jgi:N-acetylneuraminate lyase
MTGSPLTGILPAVVTPFDERGRFAEAPVERLLHFVYEAGVHGVYVCGQTGEGLLQRVESRRRATELAVRHSPKGKTVVVHVGAHRLDDAVELAAHARRAGAHAISSLPPAGTYSFAECRRTTRRWPPPRTSRSSSITSARSTLRSAPPIRSSSSAPSPTSWASSSRTTILYKLLTIKRRGATVFNGRDEVLVGLLMGADGGMGTFYNLVPQWFVELYGLAKAGDWNAAQRVQTRINDLIRVGLSLSRVPRGQADSRVDGLESGRCVAPRRSLTEAEELQLRTHLDEKGLLEALRHAASAGH